MRKTIIAAMLLFGSAAHADCQCACVNGKVRVLCSSSMDLEPICPPRVCPIVPPSVKPLNWPTVPPVGTSRCVQRQVWDERQARYVWRQVCY